MNDTYLPYATSSFEKGFLPEIVQVVSYLLKPYPMESAVRDSVTCENLFAYLHSYRFRKFMASKNYGNSYFHYLNAYCHDESKAFLLYLKYFFILALKEVIGDSVSGIKIDINNRKSIMGCSAILYLTKMDGNLEVVPYPAPSLILPDNFCYPGDIITFTVSIISSLV